MFTQAVFIYLMVIVTAGIPSLYTRVDEFQHEGEERVGKGRKKLRIGGSPVVNGDPPSSGLTEFT